MELKALPAEVIHKLRSGVAIVSLAHCMEELVLNALDAGATCIAVRLNMHYHKVQVVDNGHGMPTDQLEKCGERYCTSKCRTLRDLDNPKYYGYRGEAISSIVEMSGLVQIESKSSTCAQSWCKTFSLGKLRDLAPSATNRPSVGTTVTVLDFMYNLPVRRGSVSEAIDFEFCLQHLEGIALSHPEVSFTLRNDVTGEKHFQTHKTNSVLDIFAQLFGARKAATLKQASLKKKSMMSEDEPAGVDHAMPALISNCVNNGPKDRPVPSTARRYFSLGQLNLTLNNSPRVDQEDVKRSPFSKNVQSVTPVQATLSRTSPVADVAQPSAGNNSSSSTEIAEYELGGLTQPSPRESQLQQSGNSHGEPDAIDISTVQQQVSDPIEGTCVDVEDQPGIVDGPGNVGDNTATVELYPGDWASCIDPMTGEKVFINMTSGNSCFTLPPLCLEPDAPVAEPPNVTSLRTSLLAPAPSVPQFLPRPQDERTRFGCTPDPEQADVADMVRVWNNPVFACNTGQDIANGGLLSKENCTAALYKITQLYKFTKEMLAYVKVIGQVDAKFIACLMPVSHNGVVQEESLVVLFDQHAAHERVRLEWLLENQYEARGQAKCVRSSSLKTELTVALEPNTLRRAALCEKEMRRLGIHYTVHDCCLSFTRLPVCLLERDEGEQRAGRPSTLASRMEELVRDHTETLLGTRHSAIALPKFLMDVLSSQACHGAIRFGSVLEKHECVKILKALSKCRLPFQCAHGRPSLTPIVDLRFLPSEEKGQQRPNLAGLHARLKGNGNNGENHDSEHWLSEKSSF
ncbi:hypothetical protein V5799_028713 [Amblyomma americanum]|uniref:MutL C-terminal dimerisation domain-containing protein n=1 Tax=Amblyomma americanum TaxID=6943 RepID=A0AAQ4DC29_AMBAM